MNECRVNQQLFVHLSVHLSYFTFYSELQFGYSIVRLRLMRWPNGLQKSHAIRLTEYSSHFLHTCMYYKL